MHFDDALDVAIVHGCGGITGAFLTGLFAEKSVNPINGADGAFYGRPIQLWYQIAGILTAIGFAAACTAGILYPLDWIMGIRLAEKDELEGLDIAAHGESWEITASRAVSDLVKKVLQEQGTTREEAENTGTFELHYKPKNPNKKSLKIPLFERIRSRHSKLDSDPLNNNQLEQNHNETKFDDDPINKQPINTHIIRF
ncbi:unnamed protein product [Rotaria sp. Silwood2]|nr:unnamed protein product [Rotaria sp. Silwood2]